MLRANSVSCHNFQRHVEARKTRKPKPRKGEVWWESHRHGCDFLYTAWEKWTLGTISLYAGQELSQMIQVDLHCCVPCYTGNVSQGLLILCADFFLLFFFFTPAKRLWIFVCGDIFMCVSLEVFLFGVQQSMTKETWGEWGGGGNIGEDWSSCLKKRESNIFVI